MTVHSDMVHPDASLTFPLTDGRVLGYAMYGPDSGFPIIGLHGTPGSRLWQLDDDLVLDKYGVRFIAIDRPGYGLSTSKPDRTILDLSDDLRQLLQSLNIDRFSVLGISGGGVYAAGLAYSLYPMIHKAGLVSTIRPFEKGKPPKSMGRVNRSTFNLARKVPWLLRFFLRQQRKIVLEHPESYKTNFTSNISHLCTSDQEIMRKPETAVWTLNHMREAFRQGVGEIVRECRLLADPWGFRPQDIQTKIELWHGEEDTLAPIDEIKKLLSELSSCHSHFLPEKGHFLDDDYKIWGDIINSLMP